MSEFNGIEIIERATDTALGVGHFPYRKGIMLYKRERGRITPIAYIKDKDKAEWLVKFLTESFER